LLAAGVVTVSARVGRVWGDFRRYADQRDYWLSTGIKSRERDRCFAERLSPEAVIRNGQKSDIPPKNWCQVICAAGLWG